jgi:hypothetical protein
MAAVITTTTDGIARATGIYSSSNHRSSSLVLTAQLGSANISLELYDVKVCQFSLWSPVHAPPVFYASIVESQIPA